MKSCVFAGTFDPFSNGHLDIAVRASKVFDNVIIAISPGLDKKPMFSIGQRAEMARLAVGNYNNISVQSFDGLLTDFLKKHNIKYLVRGLRTGLDFEYESTLFDIYKSQFPDVECLYFMTGSKHIQGMFIRELIRYGGDYSSYVPKEVLDKVKSEG